MVDITKDLSILTTIPEKSLHKFFRKMIFCSCEAVQESVLANEDITELDVGIGTLYIKNDPDDIRYHFEPNELFAKSIEQTIVGKKNVLEDILNDALFKKFTEVYKDLC